MQFQVDGEEEVRRKSSKWILWMLSLRSREFRVVIACVAVAAVCVGVCAVLWKGESRADASDTRPAEEEDREEYLRKKRDTLARAAEARREERKMDTLSHS